MVCVDDSNVDNTLLEILISEENYAKKTFAEKSMLNVKTLASQRCYIEAHFSATLFLFSPISTFVIFKKIVLCNWHIL